LSNETRGGLSIPMIAAMPSYNEGQVIAEVILGYKKCTDKVVVDDESSENTLEIDEFI